MEIILDHPAPFYLLRLRDLRVTVAGEIHVVESSVDIIKVDRLGLSRLGGRSRQRLPVHVLVTPQTVSSSTFLITIYFSLYVTLQHFPCHTQKPISE